MIIEITGSFINKTSGYLPHSGKADAILALFERHTGTFNSNGVNTITITNGDNKAVESYGVLGGTIDEQREMRAAITNNTTLTVTIDGSDPSTLTFFVVLRPA